MPVFEPLECQEQGLQLVFGVPSFGTILPYPSVLVDVPMRYTYKCDNCNWEEDKEVSPHKVATTKFKCPVCKHTMRKLINKVAVHYKGSGFTLSKGDK